ILDDSFNTFPKEDIDLQDLNIDTSIFFINHKYQATFKLPIPTSTLHELANQAEKTFCHNNSIPTSTSRHNTFFYKYFIAYQNIAAQNHNINKLSKDQAIDLVTQNLIETDFLARIITYFDIIKDQQPSSSQTSNYYINKAYKQAENIIVTKFNLNFIVPSNIDDSLFL
ncbi:25738_t:CDS:1, partial [Dentiscutata erythropus]